MGEKEIGSEQRSFARSAVRVSTSQEAGLFGALDLRDPPVMDGELHDAEAEAFDFFAN